MVDPSSGTATIKALSDLETYFIHSGGGTPDGPYMIKSRCLEDRRHWGEPERGYSGVPHNNANRKKKSKRKQAQVSRRKNRRNRA